VKLDHPFYCSIRRPERALRVLCGPPARSRRMPRPAAYKPPTIRVLTAPPAPSFGPIHGKHLSRCDSGESNCRHLGFLMHPIRPHDIGHERSAGPVLTRHIGHDGCCAASVPGERIRIACALIEAVSDGRPRCGPRLLSTPRFTTGAERAGCRKWEKSPPIVAPVTTPRRLGANGSQRTLAVWEQMADGVSPR